MTRENDAKPSAEARPESPREDREQPSVEAHETQPETSREAPLEAPSEAAGPKEQQGIAIADKIKFVGLLVFILILVGVGILLMPYFTYLTTDEGRREIIQMILDAGAWGILICLGLQFIQIVVAFIPGEITQLVIGAIYGPFWGTVITALGALISSVFIFFVVRRLGAPFVHAMISKKHADKLRFLDESRRLDVIVFVLFLIPGLPKDVFTYMVPLTRMRAANFFILSTLGRIPGITASSFIGSAAVQGDYVSMAIVVVIVGTLGLLGIIFNARIIGFIEAVENRFRRK